MARAGQVLQSKGSKGRSSPRTPSPSKTVGSPWIETSIAWIRKHSVVVFLVLVAIGSARIVSTYHVFSQTSDEPAHIAAGMEWLSKGVYKYEAQHPPLARVATAIGPYLTGVRSYGVSFMLDEGLAILYRNGHYERNIALARLGILPFFWVACVVVYLWARKYLGEPSAAFAVLCFTFLPPVLAHAGLATTDMPLTAMVGASFLCTLIWMERPTLKNSLILGGVTGLAVLCKFSSLPFIPSALAAALLWYLIDERPGFASVLETAKKCVLPVCVALLTWAFVIWAGYRFSFGKVPFTTLRLPAPELYAGIQEVIDHNNTGHFAYFLGEYSRAGWWYYYFVVLALKTPLAFFGLLLSGVFAAKQGKRRGIWLALAFSFGILLFCMSSHINIGVRHVLPVYIGFSVIAGAGATALLEYSSKSSLTGWILGGLLFWLVATSALSHPDYLPYFNALVGDKPEEFLVDSDLDWGQDVKRLANRLHEVGAQDVAFNPFFAFDEKGSGLPHLHSFNPVTPTPGWNATNLIVMKTLRFGVGGDHPEITLWPEQIAPTEKIGKGIWLWYFPPNGTPAR